MRNEMLGRVIEAGKYQKMALKALFPEKANRHFKVIEHELKEIIMEEVIEIANIAMRNHSETTNEEDTKQTNDYKTTQKNAGQTKASNSKKVNID